MEELTPAASVDITGESCPMTYVRTKLRLEAVPNGAVLEVLLKGDEPVKNIPRNVRDEGHEVLSLEPRPDGVWRLLIRKSE